MFYGDFEDTGKGNNGGLAVLLKGLGNEISGDEKLAMVFTVTINEKVDKPFINNYKDRHIFIRLPIYIDREEKDPFIKRELFIKRYISDVLKTSDIIPDIFHIRYLDNASRSIAKLSQELDKKLVLTLAPDPHRNIVDESGNLKKFSFDQFLANLNKIKIGDELIYQSDGVVGIGNETVEKELNVYFPQFKEKEIKNKLKMINEGIPHSIAEDYDERAEALYEKLALEEIGQEFLEKPIILNVGRLDSLKGQTDLLKAWGDSKLSDIYNLLIIGGDLVNPSKEEKRIIGLFKDYLSRNPQIENKFLHIGAQPNESVRYIEKLIMTRRFDYPHIYLCSSKKEEFGIAILEAMSQGFLIIAPIKGGVKSYITSGENGFLINTDSAESISKETEDIIYHSNLDKLEFKKIQEAGKKTEEDLFSIEKVAKEFISFYISIKGEVNNEV